MVGRGIAAAEPSHRGPFFEVEEDGVEAEEGEADGDDEEDVGFATECGAVEPCGGVEPALGWGCERGVGFRLREEEGEEGGAGGEAGDGLHGVVEAQLGY